MRTWRILPTVIVTVEPGAALDPPTGDCRTTMPSWLGSVTVRSTTLDDEARALERRPCRRLVLTDGVGDGRSRRRGRRRHHGRRRLGPAARHVDADDAAALSARAAAGGLRDDRAVRLVAGYALDLRAETGPRQLRGCCVGRGRPRPGRSRCRSARRRRLQRIPSELPYRPEEPAAGRCPSVFATARPGRVGSAPRFAVA